MAQRKKYTIEQLTEAVKTSKSIRQVLLELGLNPDGGGNAKNIKNLIKSNGLDTSHMLGKAWLKGSKNPHKKCKYKTSEVFSANSPYRGASVKLKNRYIKEFNVPYRCSECGISQWRGKKIVLQIDHINGVNDDNRNDNLRLLCPNCHSMTETYCGKNAKKKAW